MIGTHLRAFMWLRWRLLNNQWRKAGSVNAILMTIVVAGAVSMALPLFFACLVLGAYLIPRAAPEHLMYAWDAVILVFLFFWLIGLLTELQRSEPLALTKFLYLPVSVHSAFLINYVGSLLRLSLIAFGPVMLGFGLALVWVKGIMMLPVLPLLAAFVLMISALTYQLQGWLGAVMSNPRRRRTVVVGLTAFIVLAAQVPNMVNMMVLGGGNRGHRADASRREVAELTRHVHEIGFDEFRRRKEEIEKKYDLAAKQANRVRAERWTRTVRLVNVFVPVGWLPLGVASAAEGRMLPPLLGLLGMSLIGSSSLFLSYRATIRQYQGEATSRRPRRAPAERAPALPRERGAKLLEARLPGISEPVAAIALGNLRALMRAPEAKMMLLTPLIMVPVFGIMLFQIGAGIPAQARPLLAFGALLVVLMGLLQMMANQFGFDRDGFRVYVLSAAPRRDILLGKNLAFAPVALVLALPLLALLQFGFPLPIDLLAAMVPQLISMFLMFCLFANLLSIMTPAYVAAGALKPASPKLNAIFLQLLFVFTLLPLSQGLTLVPYGVEALSEFLGWTKGVPICLMLSLVECGLIILLYGVSLDGLGRLLQAREQRILDTVTQRAA